jgi:RTX calcium-binding nonapeptide repeat (4 copies)
MRRFVAILAIALLAGTFAACEPPVGTPVPDTVIDFEQDTIGTKQNGFTSADSPLVHLSSIGSEPTLALDEFAGSGEGALSLYANDGFGPGDIRMVLDRPTNRISLRFGFDFDSFSEPGDEAVLTVFRGTTEVGQTRIVLNRNGLMDQAISFQNGPLFNRVTFAYNTAAQSFEVIDRIVIGPLCTIAGTEAAETLTGTPSNDVICGGGGADTIFGRGGNDHITGGNGNDNIQGEAGHDFIAGNFQNDTIRGGPDNDRVEGGEQSDNLFGDEGNDTVSGGPGTDTCNGGPGTDTPSGCETTTGF